MKHRGWLIYLAVAGLGCAIYPSFPLKHESAPLFNALGGTSIVAILAGAWLHKPASRLPWLMLAAGLSLFVIGDVITTNYSSLFHHQVHSPSLSDAFYLSVYPLLSAGILLMIRRRTPGRDRDSLIDSLIVAIGLGLVAWEFVMAPYARDLTLALPVRIVSMAYPMMDVLLLAVLVRLAMGAGLREPSFHLLMYGSMALLLTDSAYGISMLSRVGSQSGGPLEVGWLAFYLLWGAAALHPSMRTLTEPA